MQAHAYAQGSNIHIAPGQEQHLPHEAWHVVQQKQGRVQPTLQMKGITINDDTALEQEADIMGAISLNQTAENQPVIQQFAIAAQPVIQRIQITVDGKKVTVTKSMTAEEIIKALGYKPGPKNYPGSFSNDISSEDAASIIEELEDHDETDGKLEGLLDDLDDIAGESDNDEEDGSGSLADGSVSDDDDDFLNMGQASLIKAIDRQDMSEEQKKLESLKKKGFTEADAKTILTGLRVQALFNEWGGKTIYLSGGGAIALYAQHRSIEDLDFRISADALDGNISWYKEDGDGDDTEWIPDEHLDELNDKITGEQFTNVPKGKTPNATNTRTAGVENFEGTRIEVSITIVGKARDTEIDSKTNIRRLSKPNLLADKLKTAISRNKIGDKYVKKVSKDIYDSLVVYINLYGSDELSADILKGHLSERANEYRESNTEINRDAINEMGIEALVEQMFKRLVKTAAAVADGVSELSDVNQDVADGLLSLVGQNIKPEIDVMEGQWFKVGKRGKKIPITNLQIQQEITTDFAEYIKDLELEITKKIDGVKL